jgi:hypothetical protein
MKKSGRVNYKKLIPPDTFLADYLNYMNPLETPYAYDFWTACWLLSVALGRSVVVNRGGAPVYLNLFTILVADSGVTRKSTAVRHATKFARGINPELQLIETKITPELFEERLHRSSLEFGRAQAAISISELVTFLGQEKYVKAMPTLLTDLYDCPELRSGGGSITSGARDLKNVFVSFLSASTPSWLVRAVNPDVIEGGFTSRVMFIVAEEPKRRQSWPEAQDDNLSKSILRQLEQIHVLAQKRSTIEISEGGRKTFARWYNSRTLHRDPFRASFQSREDAHILRLAAFLSINDGTWHIQHNHIITAIKIITEVREDGASIFEGTGTNSRLVAGIDKIRDKLLAAGLSGLPQRELTKAVAQYMDASHMKAVLDIMHDLGMVQQFQGVQLGRGRPMTIWRGAPPLASSKALDDVIRQHSPSR